MKTVVLKIKGLSDDQINEEFTGFFNKLVEKYPKQFGVGMSAMEPNSAGEKEILRIAELGGNAEHGEQQASKSCEIKKKRRKLFY